MQSQKAVSAYFTRKQILPLALQSTIQARIWRVARLFFAIWTTWDLKVGTGVMREQAKITWMFIGWSTNWMEDEVTINFTLSAINGHVPSVR